VADVAAHAALVQQIGPCIGLFHVRAQETSRRNDVTYSIVKKDLAEQPVLLVRRRVKRSEIAATIGAVLPSIFQYAQERGIALSGHPLTRYSATGLGLLTIEPAMRIVGPRPSAASTGAAESTPGSSTNEVIEDVLPAGPAATTVHNGSYETLQDAYAALEAWMESNAIQPAGAPWESYITDPAEHPDPKDWRTEVCWPIR
jgi:AraC family transcriptional regulator